MNGTGRSNLMSKEEKIISKLANSIGTWNDLQKEYLLGYVEGASQANKPKRRKNKERQ